MVKISVIVPVYNTALYLKKCIDSLINQTFNDFEIIVVNDGSTDTSSEILQEYNNNSKIKIFEKENGGLSDARNFGINKATADYLAFVDSDDWVENIFLEELYTLIVKYNAEIAVCNLQKVDQNGIVFNKIPQLSHLPETINLNKDFTVFGEASSFACNKLFKKELFSEDLFPLKLHFEDIATIPKLILKSNIIAKTNKYLYNYFERRGSISQSFNEKGGDMFQAISIVKEKFVKSKYSTNEKEWKRFVIYQGFYSLLAYIIRIEDKELKMKMYSQLTNFLYKEQISKKEIIQYKRLNKSYILHLPIKKMIFYFLILSIPKTILRHY